MIIRPTKVYLQADKIVYMNRAIYLHRKRETSVTKTVNLADVYPLQSIEERMMILQLIGAPKGLIDAEIAAYKWRLAIHEEETLKHGDMEAYQQVLVKKTNQGEECSCMIQKVERLFWQEIRTIPLSYRRL